jgi:hypothetical protein
VPMDINLTSTWIPMSLLAVLSLYMFVLFRRERREAMEFVAVGGGDHGHAPAADHGHGGGHSHAAPAPAADHGHHAPTPPSHHEPLAAAPAKQKSSIVWRTAKIWLPLVIGFGAQAYLDFGGHAYYQETIKPMLEKSAG